MKKIKLNLDNGEVELMLIKLLDSKINLLREKEEKRFLFERDDELDDVNKLIKKVIYQIQKPTQKNQKVSLRKKLK